MYIRLIGEKGNRKFVVFLRLSLCRFMSSSQLCFFEVAVVPSLIFEASESSTTYFCRLPVRF